MAYTEFTGELDKEPTSFAEFNGELDKPASHSIEINRAGEALRGLGEAGMGMVAGLPSMIAGGLHGLGALAAGQGYEQAAKNVENAQQSNFGFGAYQPSTQAGREISGKLGEAFAMPGEAVGSALESSIGPTTGFSGKLLTDLAMNFLPLGHGAKAVKGGMTKAALEIPKESTRPATKVNSLDAELSQTNVPAEAAPIGEPYLWGDYKAPKTAGKEAMSNMVRELGADEVIPNFKSEPIGNMAEDLQFKTPEARAADIASELRNAEQEFAVKKQTTLDMNAAERARQEAASVYNPEQLQAVQERRATEAATKQASEIAQQDPALRAAEEARNMLAKSEQGKVFLPETPIYELAPSGKLRGIVEEPKGAKLIEATSLESAATKLAEGRSFDLTAAERVAWNKTKPEFKLPFNFKKQGGGLYLGEGKRNQSESIKAIRPLEALLPELVSVATTPEGVVKATQGLPDVGNNIAQKATRLFTKGFLYEKFKTNNPIVKYTYDTISKAIDAGKEINHKLLQQDLLPKLRKLDATELTELHGAMLSAMKNKSELSRELLAKHGFNEKQIQTWESFKSAYKTSLDNLNNARALMGKDPVDPYTGYMAGMATGDFRTPIIKKTTDGAPQVVGIVGDNNKYANVKRVAQLLKEHPEYEAGKQQFYGAGASRGERGSALVEALSLLSDNDPNVKEFSHVLSDTLQQDAYNYQGAKKHTMQKKGVFGMEGSKPWETAEQNALDGFRAQIRYIETMSKWSELSKATQQLKEVFSNPEIQESQRNALDMSKQYLDNALGMNPMEFGRWLDKGVGIVGKNLGLGPSYFDSAIRGVRGGINTVFFALKPTFLAANAIQGMVATPKMVNFLRGRGFDVAGLDKTGLSNYMKSGLDGLTHIWAKEQTPFAKEMWKYGEAHGISSTQIFEHSTDIRQGVSHAASSVLEAGMGMVEGGPRSMMYAMFSNILKDNGYAKHPDIFKVARELTDMSMGDYRAHEGQRINQAAGPLAPLLGNLSTFAGNENSMIALLAREAKNNKSYAPIIAAITTGLLVHGIMGFPGFDEASKLYEFISTKMGKPSTLTNEILTMAQKEGKMGDVLAMGMPAYAGIDTHQVLGRSSALPAIFGGGGAGKAVDIGAAAVNVAGNPTNEMAWKRAAYEGALGAMKGPMDLSWFSQGDVAMNKKEGHATEGQYKRSQFDKNARLAGLFSVPESKAKEAVYQQSLQDKHYKEMQQKAINYLGDRKVSSKGLRQEDISEGLDRYIAAEGDPTKFANEIVKFGININTTAMQRYLMAKAQSGNLSAVKALQRMNEKTYAE